MLNSYIINVKIILLNRVVCSVDNEIKKMFELVIDKLDNVDTRIGRLETRFDGLETRFDGLEARFDGLEPKFDVLETRLNGLELRQDEIYQVVKAIEHSNQVHKAELDSLNLRIAHTEGTLTGIGEYIMQRRATK